jgi:hypothetical protein
MSAADMLLQDVLKLPTKKRSEIALRIMESLDGKPAQDVESAWAAQSLPEVGSILRRPSRSGYGDDAR